MRLGVYEKGLPEDLSWPLKLERARAAGFDFIEMAVDESQEMLSRLDWSIGQRMEVSNAVLSSGTPIYGMVLSAHRKYAFGSVSVEIRRQANEIMKKALDLAFDVGARIIQIAGYYVFYEEPTDGAEDWFLEGLNSAVGLAAQAGIMLGLENMDGRDVTSITKAMRIVDSIKSPWLQLYPDLGNLSANGLEIGSELRAGQGHIVGVHLKDTRPGEFRKVAFGDGVVPFAEAFRVLKEIDYRGPFLIEMWNQGWPDAHTTLLESRSFVIEAMAEGGFLQRSI
jgi:L-ribulose-5-phosphate 3-epimerase